MTSSFMSKTRVAGEGKEGSKQLEEAAAAARIADFSKV
jgi:hypothetical protein